MMKDITQWAFIEEDGKVIKEFELEGTIPIEFNIDEITDNYGRLRISRKSKKITGIIAFGENKGLVSV